MWHMSQQPTLDEAVSLALTTLETRLIDESAKGLNIIVIHDTDNDGHMAAYLFEKVVKEVGEGIPHHIAWYPNSRVHQDKVVNKAIENANCDWNTLLVFLDVSPSESLALSLLETQDSETFDILVIDHHQSAWNKLCNLRPHILLAIPEGNPASTAKIALDMCIQAMDIVPEPVYEAALYVDARDRWQKDSPLWPDALDFVAGLRYHIDVSLVDEDPSLTNRQLFAYFAEYLWNGGEDINEVCRTGSMIRRREAFDIANYIKRGNIRLVQADVFKVAIYVSHLSPSDLGNAILVEMPEVDFTMQASLNTDGGMKVELRSRDGAPSVGTWVPCGDNGTKVVLASRTTGFDVGSLASLFDGGGHKAAAGFNLGYLDPIARSISGVLGGQEELSEEVVGSIRHSSYISSLEKGTKVS